MHYSSKVEKQNITILCNKTIHIIAECYVIRFFPYITYNCIANKFPNRNASGKNWLCVTTVSPWGSPLTYNLAFVWSVVTWYACTRPTKAIMGHHRSAGSSLILMTHCLLSNG